jgi:hypothetical protein
MGRVRAHRRRPRKSFNSRLSATSTPQFGY